MKVKVQKLKQMLEALKVAISVDEIIEQSNYFIFKENKIFAFNNEMIAYGPSPIDLQGAVIAKEFLELLNKFKPDAEVIIKKEKDTLLVLDKTKKRITKAGLSFAQEITLPLEEVDVEELEWAKVPANFTVGLKTVLPTCSKDSSTNVLQCIHVIDDRMETTDNFNISQFTLKTKKGLKEMNIYYGNAQKLLHFNLKKYCVKNDWVFFLTDEEILLGSRNFNDTKYPDLLPFFKDFKGTAVTLPEDLKESLSKASIFLNEKEYTDMLELSLSEGWAKLKITGSVGFLEEKVKVDENLPDFRIEISYPQLYFLINHSGVIEFGEKMARIKTENSQYISAL